MITAKNLRLLGMVLALVWAAVTCPTDTLHAAKWEWRFGINEQKLAEHLHYQLWGEDGLHGVLFGEAAPSYEIKLAPFRLERVHPYHRLPIPPSTILLEDVNLVVNVPGKRWVTLDPTEFGSRARIFLRRTDYPILVLLTVESTRQYGRLTTHDLLQSARQAMAGVRRATIVSREGRIPVATDGIQGVAFNAVANGQSPTPLYFSIWVAADNDYAYTLKVVSKPKHRREVEQTTIRFVRGLRQIEPQELANVVYIDDRD